MRGRYSLVSTLSLPPPSSSRPPERDGMFLFNHRRLLYLQNPFTRPLPKSHRNAAALPHLSRREALLQRPEASSAHLRDKPPGGGVSFVPSAVATPNSSVLSEEAFKRLDRFDKESLNVSDADYDSEDEATSSGADSEEELAISELGLPHRLVESLENRWITQLFPIQITRTRITKLCVGIVGWKLGVGKDCHPCI
ncbi:uncharacterized protein LOC130784976 isoform X2 [Actinidia eriantha]|uniref:uncharacterized protein LOC130784976 isoform X2 n=1 Tax=Actinidia eriantha TaxID=165200 RepID=UPI00258D5CC5|nr:uncharacterized protein LOC130784976 isoform X2 [Actinidia eriantha]